MDKSCCKIGFSAVDLSPVLPNDLERKTPLEAVGMFLEDPCSGKCAFVLVSDFMDFDLATVRALEEAAAPVLPQGCSIHILTTHNHGGAVCEKLDMALYGKLAAQCAGESQAHAREALLRKTRVQADPSMNMVRRLYLEQVQGSATCFYGIAPESDRNGGSFAENFIKSLQEGRYAYLGGDSLDPACAYNPFPEGDRDLFVMEFVSRYTHRPLGTILRYAAHAVCCNDGKFYSSDYPYFAREWMKQKTSGACCLFLNGPCGEIAPALSRKSPETAKHYGETLAETAYCALEKEQEFVPLEKVSAFLCTVPLPVRREIMEGIVEIEEKDVMTLSLPERKRYFESLNFRGTIPFLEAKYRNGEKAPPGESVDVKLGLLSLNDTHFLLCPGETFSATGKRICSSFPEMEFVTATEHGRTVMYLPPEEEFALGGYETICKLTSPHAERVLHDEAVRFIRESLNTL